MLAYGKSLVARFPYLLTLLKALSQFFHAAIYNDLACWVRKLKVKRGS